MTFLSGSIHEKLPETFKNTQPHHTANRANEGSHRATLTKISKKAVDKDLFFPADQLATDEKSLPKR